MSRPGTFERVYATLKAQLREGRFRPGDRLEPAQLSEELNASVTPVRDALHRLTGERLIESPPHEGFRVPLLTESALRHLYAWHRDLVLLAIASRKKGSIWLPDIGIDETPSQLRLETLLVDLARAAANPEQTHALEAVIDRLSPFRRFEALVLDAIEEESVHIIFALTAGDQRKLRQALLRYYRRRERIVPELLERLYAGGAPGPEHV